MANLISEREFHIGPVPDKGGPRVYGKPHLDWWRRALGQALGHLGHPATGPIRSGLEGAIREAGVGCRVVVRVEVWPDDQYPTMGEEASDTPPLLLRPEAD